MSLGDIKGGFQENGTGTYDEVLLNTIFQKVPVNYAPIAIAFGNATQEYDISGTTWVSSSDGTPNAASHLLAACLTAIATPYDSTYLAVRERTGAASATNPLTVQFTFTAVSSLNVIKFRSQYTGSVSHSIVFELYNGSTWDIFETFSHEDVYTLHTSEILVPAQYIIATVVLGRFRHLNTGIATHSLLIDYIIIGSGGGAGSSHIQSASETPFEPVGAIDATNVQAAIAELDSEKQAALTFGIANTNKVQIDAADVAVNDYAKFTANGLVGRSYAEVLSDIGAAASGHTHEGSPGASNPGGILYLYNNYSSL